MRARNIKPGFLENEYLAECDPLARLLFTGLWMIADRDGRLEDRPKRIKRACLGYDECDIEDLLSQLATTPNGQGEPPFIIRYHVNGTGYIQITNFRKHQSPHPSEAKSEIPPPESVSNYSGQKSCNLQLTEEQLTNQADSLIPDSLIPDSLTTPPSPLEGGERARVREADGNEPHEHCIPYSEIVGYLNQKTGKHFQSDDKKGTKTRRLIKLRWDQGFRLQDFKQVIDTKVEKWSQDDKMSDFLRPETLFGTKFESYLNECRSPPENTMDGKLSKKGQATWRNIQALRQRERGENGQGEIRQEPCWPGRDVREGVVRIPGDDLSAGHGPIQR